VLDRFRAQSIGVGALTGSTLPMLSSTSSRTRLKILAISSGGGHWVQLLRVSKAFEHHEVAFATINVSYQSQVPHAKLYPIGDANRHEIIGLLKVACRILRVLQQERPDVIISTGAAPGYLALRLGRLFGAKTIWLESIANVEQLSMSGRRVGPYADLWLTQWPELARPEGPLYVGAVI
jgi:UDP-N-acetylglucosamine:LPS N-acetylglucosamine transferase